MTKLSKYEKETIINWNEAENLARTSPGCRSGSSRRTARNEKPLPAPTPKSMAFRW